MVTTHLVLFSFFNGASASAVIPQARTPGGSGKRYPVGNLDLATWQKNRKKLEAKVEVLQKKIEKKRAQVSAAPSMESMNKLAVQLAKLQKLLLELLAQISELNKSYEEAEEAEVLAIYLAYRTLH